MALRRKFIRAPSADTEAEFDAALDAAVEAAYDDGYEPAESSGPRSYDYDDDDEIVANVRRKVELAKERVRQSEREAAIQDSQDRERRRLLESAQVAHTDSDANDTEDEEEERLLVEMTRAFAMENFEFGLQSKPFVPRQSDSSSFSGRTFHSSMGSNPTTSGTMLTSLTEASPYKGRLAPTEPPTHALPSPPPRLSLAKEQSVRSRRLSGQNAKLLKIETTNPHVLANSSGSLLPSPLLHSEFNVYPKSAIAATSKSNVLSRSPVPQSARLPATSFLETAETPSPLTTTMPEPNLPRSGSPGLTQTRSSIRQNFSSTSLKHTKSRNPSVSVSNADEDPSPTTPGSSHSTHRDATRLPVMPALPTPIAAAYKERMDGAAQSTGQIYFDNDIHSPGSPKSPHSNANHAGSPIPLEPCPSEFLLRPFWLMRALFQTIAHPRGGYLSTKLFVPRDVWRVKGVKLKNIEDKIANCDFLTAALMRLAQVDTFDADAVLEEMQALEAVLEQVQVALTKKLGNEVGVQGGAGMFKDAPASAMPETDGPSGNMKSGSMSSKSSAFSWRRLRPKNSAMGLTNGNSAPGSGRSGSVSEAGKESLNMGSLPMTTTSKVRFPKRDMAALRCEGPNAHYMSSLARLFDAAQVVGQCYVCTPPSSPC